MKHRQGLMILELIEDRYNVRSTIMAAQIPTEKWHKAIKDPTVADAVLDRFIHNSYMIDLEGDSMRGRNADLTEEVKKNKY